MSGECGTYGGYKRHLRKRPRERPCDDCRRANRDAKANWSVTPGAGSAETRDKRNSLPETPGYRWRAGPVYPWAVAVLARAEAAWGRPEDEEAA